MNSNFPLAGPVRMLLFPLSLVYYMGIWCRNKLYDAHFLKPVSFNLPIICVGNLSVGGTGKSPMVEYLVRLLQHHFAVATLSRGYKRKTKGYALADQSSTALEIGDEPMLFYNKFPGLAVSVGEKRLEAIPQLLYDRPETRVIIMDDAFQHRSIKSGYNILLVDYNKLFTRDWYLPTGDLRDEKKSYRRADLIVITKCHADLSLEEKQDISAEIEPMAHQHLFFSTLRYGQPYHIISKNTYQVTKKTEVLLVTGIADPTPLKNFLQKNAGDCHQMSFKDHQVFTIDDLNGIVKKFEDIAHPEKIILTTEKDAVRLIKFESVVKDLPLYVIPVQHEFMFNEGERFNELVKTFIHTFKQHLN